MNTPNNKRKRESIQRIEQAFIELLQSRGLEQISISELCKRAGLNRSTFYANYADLYALADSIRDKLEQDLSELYQCEITLGFNSHDYLRLFRHIYDNQMFYKTYFKLGYDNNCKPFRYDAELARHHFQNRFVEYHMEFFKAGLNRIIELWLESGCREPPENMAGILDSEYQGRMDFCSAQP